MLNFILHNSNIDINDVQRQMRLEERNKIIQSHPYTIWQGNDGRWRTHLNDNSKADGRRLIAKSSRSRIEDEIIKDYNNKVEKVDEKELTIETLYPKWLRYKNSHTNSSSYVKRINNDWNKFYKNDPIIKIPVCNLQYTELDTWVHELIKTNNMNKTQYYNMAIIMRQCMEYAKEKGIISENVFSRIKVRGKIFNKPAAPKDNTQVFIENEQKEVIDTVIEKFNNNQLCTTPLAIALNFQLGLRIGELVAIKWSDIERDIIHIQRMEIETFDIDDNGNVIPKGTKIANYTKSEAGDREIFLNKGAKKILNTIRQINLKNGYYDDSFVFISMESKKRITSKAVTKQLYAICDTINVTRKSNHKIRKTYISSLIDGGLNINTVRTQAGHEDEKTTLNNYCFDRKTDEDKMKSIEKALPNCELLKLKSI